MSSPSQLSLYLLAASSILLAGSAQGQGAADEAMLANTTNMKFGEFPGLPTCATGSVQSGDPAKGPSFILVKAAAGCSFPWHWHTATEHVMMVSGLGRMEMKDVKPLTLRPGGFARLPSRHIHRLRCSVPCSLYVHSDAAFDIHYVDGQDKEISPDEALKAVKETAAKAK